MNIRTMFVGKGMMKLIVGKFLNKKIIELCWPGEKT